MNVRAVKDGPWCWQSKAARRRIREAFDATNNVTTALAVYDALAEIASDAGSEVFQTTHAWIQRMSGVGVSTIKKHLGVLGELRLVAVSSPVLRAPSTYTLLSIATDCPTIANGCLAIANAADGAPLAASEEQEKKIRRKGLPSAAQSDQGPAGWQAWIDTHLPESAHATGRDQCGPWHAKDKATRKHIEREMASAGN